MKAPEQAKGAHVFSVKISANYFVTGFFRRIFIE